ncbi:glucose-6-phosphate dehydrogenase assembly protein OpcA [Solicola gregarius]|uniref:Glucose-6-phosphate dehydrogenase assembly protein OpcA n=1 Tax=Solicola gregarius TaxID=2908642 RepID=A0AA46YJZ7_9ACTN|nr:glucose-6-phosphate dehydrogenase assembly protein OpcA [Solicola gregarius]UYM04902.1 glucose-6-phosphate dehydrogenase assembly protein OpcA [Solicola gregarius]
MFELTDTTSSDIANALVRARRNAGSPAMDMVMTLVVVTDEASHYDAMKAAGEVSSEHPSRVIGLVRRSTRGAAQLDARVSIGDDSPGESLLLRVSGELVRHAESAVLPLLLPDSPVVVWWPTDAPDNPSADAIGSLAQRRITDAAAVRGSKRKALVSAARHYAPGDTDLAWTRLTPWRALLAAAVDQVDGPVTGGRVSAARANPSADLMCGWLEARLGVEITHTTSRGPGLTDVRLQTPRGEIAVHRDAGTTGTFTIPGEADRPVALNRRTVAECLAEDLRRLDEDEVYAQAVRHVLVRVERAAGDAKPKKRKASA